MEEAVGEAADSAVSATVDSPARQGDLVAGLALAVVGSGTPPASLATSLAPTGGVGGDDAHWTVLFRVPTGWYAVLSQDCDLLSSDAEEPTVMVAPVVAIEADLWATLSRGNYSSRLYALPGDTPKLPALPDGAGYAVDLAWSTAVMKTAVTGVDVDVCRVLTGPQRLRFGQWLGLRTSRVPFNQEIVDHVINPSFTVRDRLAADYRKKGGGGSSLAARGVGACAAWYARQVGSYRVEFLGELDAARLSDAGFVAVDAVDNDTLAQAGDAIEAAMLKRMQHEHPDSGYEICVYLRTLDRMKAADFRLFAPLVR